MPVRTKTLVLSAPIAGIALGCACWLLLSSHQGQAHVTDAYARSHGFASAKQWNDVFALFPDRGGGLSSLTSQQFGLVRSVLRTDKTPAQQTAIVAMIEIKPAAEQQQSIEILQPYFQDSALRPVIINVLARYAINNGKPHIINLERSTDPVTSQIAASALRKAAISISLTEHQSSTR